MTVSSILLFGCRITVEAGGEEAERLVDSYVFPSVARSAPDGDAEAEFRLERAADRFRLYRRGELAASSPSPGQIIAALQNLIDGAVVERLRGMAPVHAAVAAWQGTAVLLPGSSHCGKSTLVSELLRAGWTYFSDEYAMIDAEGLVYPYPRALMLRDGAAESSPAAPERWALAAGREPARVGVVAAVEHRPAAQWSVDAVPQSEMVVTLLKHTPHVFGDRPGMLGPLARLCAGAACYAGVRGEAAEAAGRIRELLA